MTLPGTCFTWAVTSSGPTVIALGWISHLVIAPPLIITDEQIDEAIDALDAALAIADAKVKA